MVANAARTQAICSVSHAPCARLFFSTFGAQVWCGMRPGMRAQFAKRKMLLLPQDIWRWPRESSRGGHRGAIRLCRCIASWRPLFRRAVGAGIRPERSANGGAFAPMGATLPAALPLRRHFVPAPTRVLQGSPWLRSPASPEGVCGRRSRLEREGDVARISNAPLLCDPSASGPPAPHAWTAYAA